MMHIQSRALTTKSNVLQSPLTYMPEKTGVFHGLRFLSLISDFQSEDSETYLTTKPTIINYGTSGDMIFDMTHSKDVEREHNQILRFFRDMPSGSTFTIGNAEYYDPYKDLDLTKEKNESNDLLNGQYTFNKFEKNKFLVFANKDTWTDQKVNKYLSKYFTKIPQYAKTTYQSIKVTGDQYHVIENNVGYPAESFSIFDFAKDDIIQIFNGAPSVDSDSSSTNNQNFKVKKLIIDRITGVERLYLDDATGITMEDMIGSAVIINKLKSAESYTPYKEYADIEVGRSSVVYCADLNIQVSTKSEAFGKKFHINSGRGFKKRGSVVVGRANTYKFEFTANSSPIFFSTTPDGVHNGGTKLRNGITEYGENGKKNHYVTLTIDDNTPKYIYYYNETYPNMGGRIHVVNDCSDLSSGEKRHVEFLASDKNGLNDDPPPTMPSTPPPPPSGLTLPPQIPGIDTPDCPPTRPSPNYPGKYPGEEALCDFVRCPTWPWGSPQPPYDPATVDGDCYCWVWKCFHPGRCHWVWRRHPYGPGRLGPHGNSVTGPCYCPDCQPKLE